MTALIAAMQRTNRQVCRLVLVMLLAWMVPLGAAPIQPPLHVLFDPLNSIIAGTLVERAEGGDLVFRVDERLHGTDEISGDRIEISAPPWIAAGLTVGERYLVGYTPFARDPQRVRVMIVNPHGPRLLVSPGLEPALYPDGRAYRDVLAYGAGGAVAARDDAVATLLGWLESGQAPLQTLAAAQLTLDPALPPRLTGTDIKTLKAAFADVTQPWAARHWLYELGRRQPDRFGRPWLRRSAIEVLATAPLTGYAEPVNAGDLVGAAFLQADLDGWTVRERILARWLESDSPAMAERALLQMRRQDPELERRHLEQALARPALPPTMRSFLDGHRQRLERMRNRQRAG